MNFQTGTATSFDNLLDILAIFLTSNGYTQNAKTAVGENTGQKAHFQKAGLHGTLYVNLKSFIKDTANNIWNTTTGVFNVTEWNLIDGLAMNLSKSYSAGESRWNFMPGVPTSGNGTSNPFHAYYIGGEGSIPNYWFFQKSNPEIVVVVVEFILGFYTMFYWAEVNKNGAGSYVGGQCFGGSTHHYAPVSYHGQGSSGLYSWPDPENIYRLVFNPFMWYDRFYLIQNTNNFMNPCLFLLDEPGPIHGGINGWLGPCDNTGTTNTTYTGTGKLPGLALSGGGLVSSEYTSYPQFGFSAQGSPARRSANSANLVSGFMPIYMFWQGALSGGQGNHESRFLGTLSDEFFTVNMRDFAPKQTISFGPDNYIVFPFNQKPEPFTYDEVFNPSFTSKRAKMRGMGMAIRTN